jgi:hypothetical protein
MSEVRRNIVRRIAAQQGHFSESAVDQYVKYFASIRESFQREFVGEFLHGLFDEDCDSPERETLHETTSETCPPSHPLDRIFEARPCLSARKLMWDPIAWDFPDSMYCASALFPSNLVRCWSDLDRTGQLVAHLTAQEL